MIILLITTSANALSSAVIRATVFSFTPTACVPAGGFQSVARAGYRRFEHVQFSFERVACRCGRFVVFVFNFFSCSDYNETFNYIIYPT